MKKKEDIYDEGDELFMHPIAPEGQVYQPKLPPDPRLKVENFLKLSEADYGNLRPEGEAEPTAGVNPAAREVDAAVQEVEPAAEEHIAQEAEPPKRKRPRATKRQVNQRLGMIGHLLLHGTPMHQINQYAREFWKIGRRMVQLYVKRVKSDWAKQASEEDYLAHLWQAKLQRDQLYEIAMRSLQRADDPRVVVSLLRAAHSHLKERDELMASMAEHRAKVKRDESPDSSQETLKRRRILTLPFEEIEKRLLMIRDIDFMEWAKVVDKLRVDGTLNMREHIYDQAMRALQAEAKHLCREPPKKMEGWR